MKKYLILLLLLIPNAVFALEINSENYVLYNLNDNQIIIQENLNEKDYVASLTKIATAIVAIENIDNLDESIVIPKEGLEGLVEANASVAGFRLGQTVTYRDLLYGLMLPSGADAAQTLAYYIAGSNDEFVTLMNNMVINLNLTNTNFTNTTGLHDDNHYSTVYDISQILMYALENDDFKKIFTSSSYLTTDKTITFKITYDTIMENYDLTNNYITGAKTGFTNQSGYCFASTATFNDIDFLFVTTGAPYATREPFHIIDAINTYDYVSLNYKYSYIYEKGDILSYISTTDSKVHQYNIKADSSYQFYTEEDFDEDLFTYEYTGIDTISPNTKKESIGVINVLYDNVKIHEFDVIYDGSLEFNTTGFIKEYLTYIILIPVILTSTILIIKRVTRKMK